MHLKHIKLVILKILLILRLCNFKFNLQNSVTPPSPNKITPHQNKNFRPPPTNTFLKFSTPPAPQAGGVGVHAMQILRIFGVVFVKANQIKFEKHESMHVQ